MSVRWLICGVIVMLASAALGGAAASAQGQTVRVRLTEWAVTADPASIRQGETAFTAENVGAAPHNLVVIRTDLAADALPMNAEGQIDRSHLEVVIETKPLSIGEMRSAVATLSPGQYVLVCAVPGHYQLGMRAAFTVTAGPAVEPTSTAGLQPTPATTSENGLPGTGTGPASQSGASFLLTVGLILSAALATSVGAAIWMNRRWGLAPLPAPGRGRGRG